MQCCRLPKGVWNHRMKTKRKAVEQNNKKGRLKSILLMVGVFAAIFGALSVAAMGVIAAVSAVGKETVAKGGSALAEVGKAQAAHVAHDDSERPKSPDVPPQHAKALADLLEEAEKTQEAHVVDNSARPKAPGAHPQRAKATKQDKRKKADNVNRRRLGKDNAPGALTSTAREKNNSPGTPAPTPAPAAREVDVASSSLSDMDLFWEDVYLLQKKAERELTVAGKHAVLSSLHTKLSSCKTARCTYESAKTSFQLSQLGSASAKTRFPEEFEAYLKRKDSDRHALARREDACKILLSHYNSRENAANADAKTKVQSLSEICTR